MQAANEMMFRLMDLKAHGFCCAQMIIILALEAQGRTNADLVRAAGGLCFGIDGSGEVCGALSGGACLISLYSGKGNKGEAVDERYQTMMAEFVDWLKAVGETEYGGTRCDEILEKFPDRTMCGRIVIDTYGKCMDILTSQGFDPAVGKNSE